MKKLLGILVLGLLWCNVCFALYDNKDLKSECKIAYEMITSEDPEKFAFSLDELKMADAMQCMSYFDGINETVIMNGLLNSTDSKFGEVCFPSKMSRNQLIEIYYSYTTSNKTEDDVSAIIVVYRSLMEKIPCR